MKIVVFGATGPTGVQIVQQALAQGHQVTAFARTPGKLSLTHERLSVVQGDVLDPAATAAAVQGQEAVLSALGAASRGPTTLYSDSARNIVAAMQQTGVRRLIAVTSAGVRPSPNANLFMRLVIARILRHVYADMRRMEDLLMAADLDWTIVRPARLLDGPPRGNYRVAEGTALKGGRETVRSDLAAFMLKELAEGRHIREGVAIAY